MAAVVGTNRSNCADSRITFAVDVDVAARLDHGGLDEPRQSQADEDVEHVAAYSVGDSHVSVAYEPIQSVVQFRRFKDSLNGVATMNLYFKLKGVVFWNV